MVTAVVMVVVMVSGGSGGGGGRTSEGRRELRRRGGGCEGQVRSLRAKGHFAPKTNFQFLEMLQKPIFQF